MNNASENKGAVVDMAGTGKKRILWLDGLKGLACFFMFLAHWGEAVYPRVHFGSDAPLHTKKVEDFLHAFPLDGWVFVAVFCICSGMMLSLKVMKAQKSADKLRSTGTQIVKRYLRLMLPMVPVAIVVWILGNTGAFWNVKAAEITGSKWLSKYYTEAPSIVGIVESVLVKTWFYGDDTISTAFWMMYQIFYGSMMSILMGMVYWVYKRKAFIIYGITFIVMLPRHDYVAGFALGAILALGLAEGIVDEMVARLKSRAGFLPGILGIVFFVVGIILGAYPGDSEPMWPYTLLPAAFIEAYYSIGGFLVILGVWMSGGLQRIFTGKVMLFMGKISYELFLVHIPIMFSLGMWLWMLLFSAGMSYHAASLVTFTVICAVVIVVSWGYSRTFTKWCAAAAERIEARLG